MPAFDSYWISLAVCGVISFIFYLFIMITMLRYCQSNELKSSFFKIWISLGVADCLHFLHSYFLMRLPLLGVFSSFYKAHVNGFLPKCALMGTYYFLFVQLFGNLLFALNRYTALTKLGRHEQIWTQGHRLVLILAAQWLVPVVLVAQVLREVIVYQLLPDGTLLLTTNKTEDFLVNTIFGSATTCIVMVTCAILYILSILSFIRHKNVSTSAMLRKNNAEIRLCFASIIVFVAMTVYVVFELSLAVFSFLQDPTMVDNIIPNFYIINDIFAMINPWSLVLTSSSIRVFMRKMIGLGPITSVAPANATRIV